MPTNRKAIPLTRSIFIAPGTGSDVTGDGSVGAPFATWHTGAWPRIAALTYTDVIVTYQNATADTSPTGLYVLPPGVRVTVSSPWADSGLGVRIAAAGSSTTQVVDSVGLLTVNAWEAARLRWITSANGMTGQVYGVPANSTTTFQRVGGVEAMAAAAVAGDTFAIEVPSGGWAPAGSVGVDATASGAGFTLLGFKYAFPAGLVSAIQLYGTVAASGVHFLGTTATLATVSLQGTVSWGSVQGARVVGFSASKGLTGALVRGTAATLPVLTRGNNNGTLLAPSSSLSVSNCVTSDFVWQCNGSRVAATGFDIHGNTPTNGFQTLATVFDIYVLTQIGTGGNVLCQFTFSSIGSLRGAVFDAGLTQDCMSVDASNVTLLSCSGGGATAGKVGVRLTKGATVRSLGANTAQGGAGGQQTGGLAAGAWPGAGVIVTDITSAQLTANTNQNCTLAG